MQVVEHSSHRNETMGRICVSSSRQTVYNSAVKQARKEKYGKHSLVFMLLGNQDEKKNSAF